jgi:hypothetical protein
MTRKLALVSASLVITLGIAELYLQFIHYPYQNCDQISKPGENKFVRFDEKLGWQYTPYNSGIGDYGATYTFSADGFRSASRSATIDPLKPTILLVGGSVLFGHGLPFEDTFGAKLDKQLEKKYNILNFAVQGYGTDQAYVILQELLPKYKPKFVIANIIEDNILRNVNIDRRRLVPCSIFMGTKPAFEIRNGSLVQISYPIPLQTYDKIKLLVLFNRIRRGNVLERAMETGEEITTKLLQQMEKVSINAGAKFYLLDFTDEILPPNPVTNTVEVDLVKPRPDLFKYQLSPTDEHPNSWGTTVMLSTFWDTFGKDF